jgi:hypothetical protein
MNYENIEFKAVSLILYIFKAWFLFHSRFYHVQKTLLPGSYVQYGFTFMWEEESLHKPRRFLCSKVYLAMDTWNQSNLINDWRLLALRMSHTQKRYIQPSKCGMKQGARFPFMDLLPRRSQFWREVIASLKNPGKTMCHGNGPANMC